MTRWRNLPQVGDQHARAQLGPAARIRLIWGGRRRNTKGDGHGDLVSQDGVNAVYLRDPGGRVVVDERREWASTLLREAKERRATGTGPSPERLRADWNDRVEGGGRPGASLRHELNRDRNELERLLSRPEGPDRERGRRR